LRDVSACNSAALALLLEAMSYAAKRKIVFSLHDIPSELLDLARLSNVDELLLAQPSTSDYAKH
jgi:ABC-type transporter Mla MlaB component